MFRVLFVLALGLFIASCLGASLPVNQKDSVKRRLFKRSYFHTTDLHDLIHIVQKLKADLRRPVCSDRQTDWNDKSFAYIAYLDRHWVYCPQNYFMRGFRLAREGNYRSARVRYTYECCKFDI